MKTNKKHEIKASHNFNKTIRAMQTKMFRQKVGRRERTHRKLYASYHSSGEESSCLFFIFFFLDFAQPSFIFNWKWKGHMNKKVKSGAYWKISKGQIVQLANVILVLVRELFRWRTNYLISDQILWIRL